MNKLISLAAISIYVNSDESLLWRSPKEEVVPRMQKMIEAKDTDIRYILRPLSLSCRAVLNMKPKQDGFSAPMFDLEILLESLGLSLNRLQYFDLVDLINTLDLMTLHAKYNKYRSTLQASAKKDPRALWKFANTAITESQIRVFIFININMWFFSFIYFACN